MFTANAVEQNDSFTVFLSWPFFSLVELFEDLSLTFGRFWRK